MKQSIRAKRMAKQHRRNQNLPKLNLVSLMDIFTILVFFLLVNSSDVEVLSNDKSITLPDSVASTRPETNIIVMLNAEKILVGGKSVVSLDPSDDSIDLQGLTDDVDYRMDKHGPLSEAEELTGLPITIMGDKDIPYTLLKQVMSVCAQSGYRDISLAVTQLLEVAPIVEPEL